MPRTSRIVLPNHPHHVYGRGNNRRRLFSRSSDYIAFMRLLAMGLVMTGCRIWQLTLMTNHYHAIIRTAERDSLATLMKYTNQRYAQIRNAQRKGSGKLFEERFQSEVIDSDSYLRTVMLYNDTNAHRAGLVRDVADHKWSTIGFHAGEPDQTRVPRDLWTPSPWYESLGADEATRAASYRELLVDYLARKSPPPERLAAWAKRADEPHRNRVERPDRTSAR